MPVMSPITPISPSNLTEIPLTPASTMNYQSKNDAFKKLPTVLDSPPPSPPLLKLVLPAFKSILIGN